MTYKLKYIGKGAVAGIPAKDLTEDQVTLYGGQEFLLSTGLWQPYKAPEKKVKDNGKRN